MTFRQFVFNNVKRNTNQYISYFLSCLFSVTVFFMYLMLAFHPEIRAENETIAQGVLFTEVLIYGFSFLFVLYSTGSFMKSRKKEYGLLTTLGITKGQLNRMLIAENTIIGIGSILGGITLGALLSKIFLMVFAEVMEVSEPFSFHFSWLAAGTTALCYFIMFELNSLMVVWTIRTNSIIELFRGAMAPKKQPRFSWLLTLFALGLVGYAYYLAFTASLITIPQRMGTILLLIVPGTYFLFTQALIALTYLFKKKRRLYFRNTNMLTISQLVYKLKDNARLLFLVTILSAVAFTSSGVMYGTLKGAEHEADNFIPQDLSIATLGEAQVNDHQKALKTFRQEMNEAAIDYRSESMVNLLVTLGDTESNRVSRNEQAQLISHTDYRTFLKLQGIHEPLPKQKVLLSNPSIVSEFMDQPESITISLNGKTERFDVKFPKHPLVNASSFAYTKVVVSDDIYQQYLEVAEPKDYIYYTGVKINNWAGHAEYLNTLTRELRTRNVDVDAKPQFYTTMKSSMSYAFFFGIFISVLFFLAAGSILYFRLFQDIEKDSAHYKSLYRIGLTQREMKKIVTQQLGFLFFTPFVVAVIHASFAFKALQNMLSASSVIPSLWIILGFLIIHSLYFIFIRNLYISKLENIFM
ncbi:FtsX-like permease family protein [Radiobacillus deserti]|uniref:FtsX-like permease family protein n=1 Tax=Radiobacillus deserti TaxID=2594883 RepID=A0A516KDE6_9BACI|nr:FtsX-like permease family protein [Radiobacillus deserti]QDP39419.1 FtsX-like permease family protein [Radiobacillus deserti]